MPCHLTLADVSKDKWQPDYRDNKTLKAAGMVFEPTLMMLFCTICKTHVRKAIDHAKVHNNADTREYREMLKEIDTLAPQCPKLFYPHTGNNITGPLDPFDYFGPVLCGERCDGCGFVAGKSTMKNHNCPKSSTTGIRAIAYYQQLKGSYGKGTVTIETKADQGRTEVRKSDLETAGDMAVPTYQPGASVSSKNNHPLLRHTKWDEITKDWGKDKLAMASTAGPVKGTEGYEKWGNRKSMLLRAMQRHNASLPREGGLVGRLMRCLSANDDEKGEHRHLGSETLKSYVSVLDSMVCFCQRWGETSSMIGSPEEGRMMEKIWSTFKRESEKQGMEEMVVVSDLLMGFIQIGKERMRGDVSKIPLMTWFMLYCRLEDGRWRQAKEATTPLAAAQWILRACALDGMDWAEKANGNRQLSE